MRLLGVALVISTILVILVGLAGWSSPRLPLTFPIGLFLPTPTPNWSKEILKRMTTKEKIGQLFILGIPDKTLTDESKAFLSENAIGGIILFGHNIQSPEQLRMLTQELSSLSHIPGCLATTPPGCTNTSDGGPPAGGTPPRWTSIPLLIAIDEEGGNVVRLPWPHEQTAQAEITTTNQAYQVAKKRGEELKSLGINVNFAPVVEIGRVPGSFISTQGRAFPVTNPIEAEKLSLAMIHGYQDAGIQVVAKHYPGGLGYVAADPHKLLPKLNADRESLTREAEQYARLGKRSGALMVTHLRYPSVDTLPSSLSSEHVQNILRKEKGFSGVIVTDDLRMEALDTYSSLDMIRFGSQAGVDIFLISSPLGKQKELLETISILIESGDIPSSRLDESVERILRFKEGLLSTGIRP